MLESSAEGCDDNDELAIYSMYAGGTDNPTNQSYIEITITCLPCAIEVDTSADYSIMSKNTHGQKFSNFPLSPSKVEMKISTEETLTACGEMQCNVVYKGHEYTLPIIAADRL